MPPRRSSRSASPRKNDVYNGPGELRIYLESGQTYRPFTDPRRIGSIDAKKARRRAEYEDAKSSVPEAFLGVLDLEESSQWQKASMADFGVTASGRNYASSTMHDRRDTQTSDPSRSLSVAASSRASPCTPFSIIPSTYCDSYPTGPCSFDFDHYFLTGTEQNTPSPMSSDYSSPGTDLFSMDLEDPMFLAQAQELTRTMQFENVDLDLLRLDAAYEAPMQLHDAPSALHAYPCEVLNYRF